MMQAHTGTSKGYASRFWDDGASQIFCECYTILSIFSFSPDANVSIESGFLNPGRITLAALIDQARKLFGLILNLLHPERDDEL